MSYRSVAQKSSRTVWKTTILPLMMRSQFLAVVTFPVLIKVSRFYKSIEDAYSFANDTLVKLLLHDQHLIPRLRSLRHYFFLSQSSFLTLFLDSAHSELRKSARSASVSKLQSLLDIALNADGSRYTAEGEPTYKEDVKVDMAKQGVYDWLIQVLSVNGVIGDDHEAVAESKKEKEKDDKDKKSQLLGTLPHIVLLTSDKRSLAIDALQLDYTVKFPLSLVISRRSILRYQVIFRFLLHLRQVEQSLTAMWIDQNTTAWRKLVPDYPELERWRRRVFFLRTKMLAWVQQILAFVTYEVLEPNWQKLESKLAKVSTVDQLLRDHDDFLSSCMKECMLTNGRLMKVASILMRKNSFTKISSGIFEIDCHLFHLCPLRESIYQVRTTSAIGFRGDWRRR